MALMKTKTGLEFIVDDEDFEMLSQFVWCTRQANYIQSSHFGKTVFLHRLLMGLTCLDKTVVDHINCNPLDNRRSNLRVCTTRQNVTNRGPNRLNKTGYKGVSQTHRSYKAALTVHLKTISLGQYKTPQEAAEAYDLAAIKYNGEFAWLNFSREKYSSPDYIPPEKIHPRSQYVKRRSGKFNSSGFKGIYYMKVKKHYRVALTVNKTMYRLGHFKDLPMARLALENFVNSENGPYQSYMREVGLMEA